MVEVENARKTRFIQCKRTIVFYKELDDSLDTLPLLSVQVLFGLMAPLLRLTSHPCRFFFVHFIVKFSDARVRHVQISDTCHCEIVGGDSNLRCRDSVSCTLCNTCLMVCECKRKE